MTQKERSELLQLLAEKTNKVFFIVDEENQMNTWYEVYDVNGKYIAKLNSYSAPDLLFTAKINFINGEQIKQQEMLLSELQEKNRDVEPMFSH